MIIMPYEDKVKFHDCLLYISAMLGMGDNDGAKCKKSS